MVEALNGPQVEVDWLRPPHFECHWKAISDEMDKVPHIWQERWTKEQLYELVIAHRMQVWTAGTKDCYTMVVFSQVAITTVGSVLEVVLAFGNGLEIVLPALEAALSKFALTTECSRIDIYCRLGFERMLRPLGFKREAVILSRPVEKMGVH